MYGSIEEHIYLTPFGYPRGKEDKYFDEVQFNTLPTSVKDQVCTIPFSRPWLLLPMLLIWTVTVMADLRRCLDLSVRVIVITKTIESMKDSMEGDEGVEQTIVGLTTTMKSILLVMV